MEDSAINILTAFEKPQSSNLMQLGDCDIGMIESYLSERCPLLSSRMALNETKFALKCLRNSCVHNKSNQDNLGHSDVPKLVKSICHWCIGNLCSKGTGKNSAEHIELLRFAMQFIGNMIVQHSENIELCLNMDLFGTLADVVEQDNKLSSYTAMVLCTCMSVKLHRQLFFSTPNAQKLVQRLVHSGVMFISEDKETVWRLLVIEKFVMEEDFFAQCFLNMPTDSKCLVLDVMLEMLQRQSQSDEQQSADVSHIPYECVHFLATNFINDMQDIVRVGQPETLTKDSDSCRCIMRVVHVLCEVTSSLKLYRKIQDQEPFLHTAIVVLRSLHDSSEFSKVVKLSDLDSPRSRDPAIHPAHGFKRDLIRIIGNMCYKHPPNQNTVRDMKGLEVILDCCKVDDVNPFVTQWAVLAIRNLCENCPENQALVSKFQKVK